MGRQLKEQRSKQTGRVQPKNKRARQVDDEATTSAADEPEFDSSYAHESESIYVPDDAIVAQIPDVYAEVSAEYWRRVDSIGYKFIKPEQTFPEHTFDLPPELELIADTDDEVEDLAPGGGYEDEREVVHKIKAFYLGEVPTFPTMRYWTHTNVNIVGQSEYALSHLPYLGDEVSDKDVLEDLLETYDEGIHGQSEGCGDIMNDYLLFKLVDQLLKKNNLENHGNDLIKVMSSVYHEFPNKASARDLVSMYPDLVARYDPDNAIKRTTLYNEFGEFTQVFPASAVLSSTAHLMCKRCATIDCIFHSASVTMNDVHIERDNDSIGPGTKPCGEFCYRHFESKSPKKVGGGKRRNSAASPQKSTKNDANQPEPEWTAHEKTVVNTLMAAKLSSNCRLQQIMTTLVRTPPKTCKQVYDYIKANEASFDNDISDPSQLYKNKRKIEPATNSHHRMFRSINGGRLNNNKPYRSCNHLGECSRKNGCSCRLNDLMCTKYCGCPVDCQVRFPGCRCRPGNCRSKMCQCFYAGWECDPDLCVECNCQITDDSGEVLVCRNVNIQRSYQRKLYIAASEVSGVGCFAAEHIPKGEFIGEYVGEIITQDEAERRGKVYDKFKCSYLFSLNHEQAVDATRVGNVVRFVNHSKHPNCRARVMVVSGDHHIGLFALHDIDPNEELFFDYSYNKSQLSEFVYKERKNIKDSSHERVFTNEPSPSLSAE